MQSKCNTLSSAVQGGAWGRRGGGGLELTRDIDIIDGASKPASIVAAEGALGDGAKCLTPAHHIIAAQSLPKAFNVSGGQVCAKEQQECTLCIGRYCMSLTRC